MSALINAHFLKPAVNIHTFSKTSFLLSRTCFSAALLCALTQNAMATTFDLPVGTDSLIDNSKGSPVYVKASREDSLIDIAVKYLLGQEEIVRANKTVDRWYPKEGTNVLIPSSYLLPDAPRQGIVINLPEYRLYYYPSAKPITPTSTTATPPSLTKPPSLTSASAVPAVATPNLAGKVISYSVGIGRLNWTTPLGLTKIIGKTKNPTWTPPPSIRAEHLAKGDVLPEVWAAGEDNPLGLFAFRLGIPGYLLHSTNLPQGVGMQVSHGCMRLYPKDIEKMFPIVEVGTQVNIINQPVKVGWSKGKLLIESHPPLDGEETTYQQRLDVALSLIEKASLLRPVNVNGAALKIALEQSNGLPTVISDEDSTVIPSEIEAIAPNQELSAPVLEDANPDGTIPKTMIEKELEQEKMQEQEQMRRFPNSPFPHE